MLRKALVLTVGTGTRPDVDIVQPLVKTVKDSRPDYLVFVATETSRKHAEKIAAHLDLDRSSFCIEILQQYDDVQAVFHAVNDIVRRLLTSGYSSEDIQVDFTSGTKAMSAGAVLSAVYQNCGSLKYITGERSDGVVKNGTERFVSLCPNSVFAVDRIKTAIQLVRKLRFSPAIDTLAKIDTRLLTERDTRLVENLKNVALAYDFWDRFEHIKFKDTIRKVSFGDAELEVFRISETVTEKVHRIGVILKEEEPVVTEEVILDLYNNAQRRSIEGRYDDALARLYRLAEMFAQYLLKTEYQITTANVDLSKVPHEMVQRMEFHKDRSDGGRIKIGLRVSYELLAALGNETGKRYMESKHISFLLNERNRTILAHGCRPVDSNLYKELRKEVILLLSGVIHDFEVRAAGLNFPWLSQHTS